MSASGPDREDPARHRDDGALRSRAGMVALAFAATVAVGILLLVAFEPEVQTIDAAELAARSDDARAFLIADYVFIALYGLLTPIAQWRFGQALAGRRATDAAGGSRPPGWIMAAALVFFVTGVVDATENALLLTATDSVSTGAVDTAHALEAPKVILFVAGTLLSVAVLVRAVQALRSA